MYFTQKISLRTLLLIAILAGGLFDGLGLAGIIDVWAFSRQWGESWGSDHRGDWDEYKIGDCGGQNHSVSGGALHMDASYGTDCFGAYYRENGNHPGMFPRNQDIRVMWRWRYPDREKYGSQAGQVTGRYGGPQYYGMSAVDTGGSGNSNDSWHVVTQGPWGTQTVDNSPKYGTDTGWHVSTFDWLCDGAMMKWWLDNDNFQTRSSSSYALPANHESRPWQFWQGNLMTSVPGSGSWTPFDIDYLHIYAVERPQLNTPTSGGGGVQPVSWSSVPNSTQPDGTAWGVQYQVQACNNSSCSSIQQSSPWLDSTSYTFTGLPLNQTYTYRARARWLGTPSLETCWGNSVSAAMTGAPKLELSQLAPAQAQYGDTIIYSLTVKNTGDAPATNVVVTDSPPAYVRLPGSSPSPGSPMAVQVFNGGSYSNGQIRWQIGSLAPGQRVTVSWWTGLEAAVPPAIDQLTNTPRATADGGLDVSALATTQILHPNISLTKSGPATSFPGDTISYQIEVENTGSGRALESWLFDTTAAGFDQPNGDLETVRDISPDGSYIGAIDQLDGVSFTAVCDEPQDQVWYVGSAKPTLVWSFDRLEAGDKQTLTFSAAVNPDLTGGSAIDNKAQLCHWHTGPEPGDLASTPLIAPQLDLSKSAPAEIWVGDPFSYQITAHNSGSVPVVEPAIYDIVPDYIINPTNISEGYGLSSSIDPFGDVTMTIGWDEPQRLEPGQAATYRWDFAVDPDTPADVTEITNHALAMASGGLSEQAQAISTLLFAVMELSKSATPVVYPGAPISYTIRVANSGGAVMQQVVITDTIPPYVTGISGISHGGQRLGDEIVWHLANIAGSSQLDLSWHGQIDPNIPRYETEIINRVAGTALATGDTAETRSSLTYPQMTLTKSGPASSSPGQPLEYTLVVENSGDAPMLDVLIRDPIPAYLLDVDVPAGTLTGGVASWAFSRLEPGERQELIWRATVAPDIPDSVTLLLNRASGTALGGIEERAEAATSLQFPRLTLDKQAPAEVWPGGQIEYAVHVENSGVVALEELVIRDFIPDYVLDPVDISHGGLVDGPEIVWQLGDLAPGATYDLVWRGTVDPAIPQARSVIRNQVQGRAAHGVSRVAEATSLVLFPALVVGKQGPAQAGPGDPVQYVIEVHNASAAPVDGVVVVDHIPEYITQPGSISGGGRVEGADIIWELGRLGGGQSRTLLWEGVIDGAVPLGRSYLDNTVTVCDESGRFCDEALYRMPLLQAEARLTKAATPYGHPGSEVEYVIRLQNSGETVLEELVIRDPLPAYIEYPHDISGGGQALPSPFEDEIAVVWRLERLAVGELVELRWRGRIALDTPPAVDAIQNRVTVTDRRGLQREAAGSTYVMHPQLRLRKQATPQAGPGEEIDYTLTLENPGQVPAYEVELVDLIPAHILTPTQISGGGLLQAADISWRFAELAAGQVVTLTWQGTVDSQIPAAIEQIANTARASNPAGLLAEDTAVTDLAGQTLALRKTATAMVEPGGEVHYALEVENRGQTAITGLTLTDPIPAYVESPAEISGGGSAANNVAVSWEIERLEAGQTYRVGWQGVVARDIPAKEAEILNEARLTSASGLALTTQARSLVRQPRLALEKSATLTAGPGEVITTVLTVRNLGGGTAYDVAVTDPLPAYLTAESSGPGVELAADRVTWALVGGLLPGASRSLTWTGRVDPLVPFDQTEIVNEATATASGGQLATAQAVTDLKAQRLALRKYATAVVSPGSEVVYTVTVQNRGQATIYDVLVSDPVPEMVRDVRDISGGGELAGNDRLRWEFPQLLPGQTISVTWRGSVVEDLPDSLQTLWNEVSLTSGSGLAAEARAKSLVRRPLFTLEKTATPLAGPGELIYTVLTVRNRGEAPAYDITITDPLPEHLEVVSVSEGGSDQGDAVSWQLTELAPGETVVLDWYGRVARDVPAALTDISSRAHLETPDGSQTEAEAVTRLKRQQVQLVKQASALVYAGGPVSYTLAVENQGEAVLYDLAVTDPLPAFVQEARIAAATSGAARVEGNQAVAWDIPALATGKVLTLTWAGVVARDIPAKATEIVNEAGLMSAGGSSAQAQAASRLEQPLLMLDQTAILAAGPGDQIEYTLTLANLGQAPAYAVELLNPIPNYLKQITSPDGEVRAEAVRWRFEELAAGETHTLTWSAFVAENIPPDVAEIVNLATARDGAGREIGVTAVTDLIQPGAPLVTKAATYEVYPGGVVSYTITLRNSGDAALYDVTVTDPIPDYVENPTAISDGGSAASGLDVIWQIDRIEAGETVSLTWQGAVARSIPAKETEIANQVTVETANGLHRTAQARSYVRQPQLTLDKTASLEAGPGGPIEYTLTLANRGLAPAYDVVVTDSIPDHLERVASPDGEVQAEAVRWRFEELAAGETHTLTWSAFVAEDIPPDVAEIVNLAAVRDGASREVEARAVTNLIQPSAPLVTKAATYDVYPGGTVAYTVTVRNPGETALLDVIVTDSIPEYVENPTAISSGGSAAGGFEVVWPIDRLEAGQTLNLAWQGTVARDIPAKETEIASEVVVETTNGLHRTAQARSFVRQPQLTLDKTATLETGPGGRIEYTLTLANRGQAPAYEVTVVDPIPDYLERAASPDGEVQADAVRWRFEELAAGKTHTLTWSAFVAEAVPPDVAEIVNLATARDGAGREIGVTAVTDLIQPGVPLVTKAATYDVYPGGTVAYTVTLRNAGQTALFDFVVTDPIPDYVENPAAVSGGGQIEGNSALVWRLDQLAAGETVSLTWQGTVARSIPAKETEIANQVTVETANGLRRTAQARSFVRQPQLTLDKTATLEAGPGGEIEYVLTLANRGQAPAYDLVVTDPIPDHLERAVSPDGEVQAEAVRWRFEELAAGETHTLTWSAVVADDVPTDVVEIVNLATARDGAGREIEARAVTNLIQPDTPLVTKAATYDVYPGGTVAYTVTVRNPGETALLDVTVTDSIPEYVENPTAISSGGSAAGGFEVVWPIDQLEAGQTLNLTWQGTVARSIPVKETEITNQVTVETANGLRRTAQARSFVRQPQLTLDKTATLEAGPGGRIDYTLTLANRGLAPAYEVELLDPIPEHLEQAASPDGEVQAEAVRWRFAELPAGASKTLTWSAFVAEAVPPDVAEIVNLAIARDGAGREIEASAVTNLIQPGAPLVTKAATYDVYPGGTVAYTVTLRNAGQTALFDLVVTDPIPDYVENPAAVSGGGQIEGNSALVWRLDQLTAGETVSLTWQGTVARSIPAKETEIASEVTVETANGLRRTAQARSFVRQPQLTLDKTATLEAGPGGRIDYTLTLANQGQAPAYKVELLDPIPEHLERAASPDGEVQANAVRWRFAELPAGAVETLTWSAFVAEDVPAELAEIVNVAAVRDGAGRLVEADAVTNLSQPDAPLLLQEATYRIYPGGVVSYTISLHNGSPQALYDLAVRNPVPTYVLAPTALSAGGRLEGNTALVWQLAALAPGETVRLGWQGQVARDIPPGVGEVASQVTVETAGGLHSAAQAVSFVQRPRLLIALAATLSAGPGDMIEYILQVGNPGQAPAYDVAVQASIPTYILGAASPGGEVGADAVRWRFAELPAGAVETLTWSGFVDPDSPATLEQIASAAAIADAAGNRAEATAVTDLPAQMVSLRQAASYEVYPGGTVAYTLTVQNRSQSRLSQITVRQPAPAYVLAPTAISHDGFLAGNLALVWELASLAPGAAETLTWQGTVDPAVPAAETTLLGQATLTSGSGLTAQAQAKSWLRRPQLILRLAGPTQAAPGERIDYLLTLENSGQAPAYSVEIRNPLPEQLTGPASPDGAVLGDAVVWQLDRLEPGEQRALSWQGEVARDVPASLAEIINRATARDQTGQQIEAQVVTRLIQPELWLAKTAPQRLSPGGTAVYTLTVSNPGQVPLYDITVSDPLPGALVPPLTVADGGQLQGASLIWQLPLLAPGERRDLHWSGGIDPTLPETEQYLWNEATAMAAGGLTARAEARSWLARPLLRLSQLATPESGAGGLVVYTLTVRNDGLAPAYGVTVNDPIPDYIEQAASPDGQVQAEAIRWQVDALAVGQSKTLTWRGFVQADVPPDLSEIINQATVTDAAGSVVAAHATTHLLPQRLDLAQTAAYQSYPGGTVVYTLTVTNRGAGPLAGVKVRNPIPAGVIDPTSISGNGQIEGNLAVVWNLDALAAGQSRVLTWQGTVDPALPVTVTNIRSEATVETAGSLTAHAETRTWLRRPLLRLDKLATPVNGAGGLLVYTLTVRNDGLAPAYGVTLTDPIPDYVEQAASPAGQVQAEAIRWQVGELAAGQSKTLTWRGFVQADVSPDLSEIVNRATVTDAAGSVVAAQATTHLLPQRLDLAQTAALRSYPGGTVVYTLTVTNRGAAGLADVIVRNPIPDGVIDPADISDDGQLAGNLAVVWQLNALPAGQSRTLTWQGTVDPALAAAVSDIRSEATATTASGLIKRTETRTWLRRPLLRLDKLATSESGAGGLVVYTLTVRNDGLAPAYGVTVNDPIPDYIEQAASPDGQVQAEAIRWQVGALAAGQSKTLTWWGAVQRDAPSDLAEIVNQATASDTAGSEVTAQAATRLLPQKLDLTQAATLRSYPGGTVVYTLTVTNRSVAGLAGVTVRSPIPAGVIDLSGISSGGQLEGNLAVVWNLDALPAGQSRVLTWQGTVDSGLPVTVTDIRSEATVETAGGLTAHAETRTWLWRPLLRLDKLATPENGAGGLLVYTLTVRNDGLAPAYGVTVTDPIPGYVEQAASPAGQVQAEAIRWQFDQLAAGQSKTLTWQGKIRGDVPSDLTGIVNQATATDAAGSAVTAQATTRLLPQKLDLAQAATYQSYPGGTVAYTLTVTNRGAAGLADVIVRNPIPDGLIDPADISGDGWLEGNLAVVWQLDALPAGQSRTLTWQGTIDPALPAAVIDVRSEATATTAGGLIKRTETRTWLARPFLRLDKLAAPESGAGGAVVYTLTLRNDGLAPAYGVTVTDPIPDYIEQAASPDGQVQAATIRWQFDALAAGQSKTLTWRGIVQADAPASLAEIVNQATATNAAGNEVTAQATTRLLPQKLALAQAATLRSYPGGTVIYTLTVTNRGAAGLASVTVRSPIPSGVIDPTGISSGGQLEGNLAVVWQLDALPAGQSQTLTWQGTVDPDLPAAVSDIRSEATATTAGGLRVRAEARTWLRQPALEIGYTASREAGPGEPVVYQITVRNNGPVPAFDIPLTASIPAYLTNPTAAQSGDIRTEAVVWRLDNLAVGEEKVLSWQGTVAEDISAALAQLASSVTVSRGDEQRSAQASTWLKAQAVSLAIAAGDQLYPGAVVTYTLVAKNEGQATLYDVQVRNSLPPYVRYISGGQIEGNEAVTWQLPRLAAGEVVSLTWQGSLAGDLPAQVTAVKNEAALSTAGGLTAHAQATSLIARPRLRLDQTAPFQAGPGEVITYALTVRNLGPAPAYDLRVENPLPAHIIDPAGLSDGGRIAGNLALLWELDSLAAGQSKTLTWRGTVDPAVSERTGQIVNRAMVEDGSGLSDEAQAVTTLLERRVDLMGAASLRSYPGGPLVYTLTVRNSGQAALDDITVTNPLPDYVAEPVSDSGQLAGNRAVSWQIPRLAAGERLELGWQAEVARSVPREITEIQSEASLVTGSGLTAQTEMRTVLQHPALLLEKWASRQAGPGEMVDYRLTLRNVGQAPAYDLTLTDPIPAYIVRPTGALSGEVRAEAVVWRLDRLAVGEEKVLSWQGQVAESVPDSTRQIASRATVQTDAGQRAEAEALTWLRRQNATLLKAASPQIYPGGPAVFTLTVENPGDTTLYGIAVSDPIPDHILGPAAISEGGQVVGNEVILWRLPGLAAGEHQTLTWRGTVAKDVPDGVSDIGSDASLTAGGLTASARATSRLDRPRLTLDSRAPAQAGPGETVVYTLTVANPSQAPAYAVEVRQPISDHLLDAGSPAGQVQAGAVIWRLTELPAGEERTLIWQGRVDPAVPAELTQLGSPATVEDASGQSDTAWATTNLLAQRLHLVQSATDLAGPGGTIAYTLTLRNLGQADLYDLSVSSPLPDHILAPIAISNGGRLAGNSALRWEVARLTSGQVLTLSWQGTVDPALPADQSDIRSMASVSTRSGLAAEAQARTRLLRPSLRLAALAPATIGPGDLISYTLLVENIGQVPAVDLELLDPIPAAIREPVALSGAGFVDHLPVYALRWKLGDLGPGQRRTVSWQGRVAPQLLTGTTHLTNSVIAQAAGGVSAQALAQTRLLHPRFELAALATPQAGPGETVVYTVVLTNTGQIPVRELLVSQPLPDHLTPIETGVALRESDPLGRPLLRWPLAPLTIAETRVITWLGRIDLSVPPALGWLDSRVTATASSAGERQATTAIRLQRPQLSLAKRVSPAHVAAGDRLTYTLVVTGSGPVTAFDVTLTDQLPDQMALLTAGDGGQLQSSALRWWLGDLRPGEVRQVSWQGQLTAAAPLSLAELRSQAVVTAAAGARATAWRSAVVRQPALALSLSGPAWVQPGETVQYGVVLTNTGQAMASSVRLTDTLPLSATLLDAPGGVISDGIVVWALGDLAANESQRVTMQVRLEPDLPPGPVLNRTEATAARGLTAQASSAAALRQPQLRLSQQAAGLASPGSLLTYTLQLHNRGDGLARTVVLTNPLPNHLDFVSASPPATLTGRILRWQPGLLATGAGFEARWTGRLALALPETAAAITNTAWAASSDLARPVTATAVLPTLPPQISAQMICPPTGQVGDVLTYTLRLHNRGGTLLTPTLALTLPPGTVYQPGSATLGGRLATGRRDVWGSPLPDQVQWHLPALYPDGRLQPRLALTVTSALSDVVWTEAKLTSHGRRSAAHFGCLTALHRPRLALAKQGPARALVGEVIEWRLSLTNSGRVTAYNPVLTDTLPPGLSYVPDSAPGVTVLTRTQPGGGWPETLLRWQAADLSPGQSLVRTFRTTVTLPLELAGYPLPFNAQNEAALENRAAAATDGAAPVTAAHLLLVPRPALTLTRQAAVKTGHEAVLYALEAGGDIGLAGPAAQPLRLAALSSLDEPPVAVAAVQAWPGSRIRHTLRGANLGPGLARQATLVEQVPAGLEVLTGTISHGGQYDPLERTISWVLGDLAGGAQFERSYTLAVPLSLRPDLAALEHNRAELKAIEAPAVFAAAATSLDDDLTLAVVKSGPATAAPGAELEYVIRLQNVNRGPLDQVTITDPLPAYTRYLTASASLPPEFRAGGRTLRWNLGMLHSGQLAEVRFKVQVDEDLPDWVLQLHNRAAVTWTGGGPVTAETTSRLPGAALPPTPTPTTTAPPPPGDDGDSGVAPPPPPPPMETPILRTTAVVSPLVTATPSLTPTGIPATAAPPTATPRPQPLLRKTVSTDTVPAGALTVLTWQLTFSNPTPLTIIDLLVRDLLPPGLLYLEAETSRGVVEVSPRSVYGRRARPGVTPTASLPLTPRPTRPSYLTAEQARLVIRPTAVASPTARVYTVLPAKTVTAATVTATPLSEPVWPGLDLADLPGTADVPPTEVLFRLGDLAPGSRVRMTIRTLVLTDARAGTRYENLATFAAANMDPGISNRVSVSVVSDEPLFILPVTGGLLELIDPRTAPGKAAWLLLALVGGGLIWYRRRKR